MSQQGIGGWRGVHAGACRAWPLPADTTCAAVARRVFRDAVSEVGLGPDLLDDCILMASELAANTLHARAVAGAGGGGNRLASVFTGVEGEPNVSAGPAPQLQDLPLLSQDPQLQGPQLQGPQPQDPQPQDSHPELWLYLRGLGAGRELVCKVFDNYRGWRHGAPPLVSRASVQAVAGRGLQIVHELSGGRWGHHLTRARLGGFGPNGRGLAGSRLVGGGRGLRGKAVWFAVPAPLAHARLADVTGVHASALSADVTATRSNGRLSARQAARELEAMLDGRGFGGQLERDDQPAYDTSVLSVDGSLTVRCWSGLVSLTTPWGSCQHWHYADLVEAAEQTVRRYEELGLETDLVRAQ